MARRKKRSNLPKKRTKTHQRKQKERLSITKSEDELLEDETDELLEDETDEQSMHEENAVVIEKQLSETSLEDLQASGSRSERKRASTTDEDSTLCNMPKRCRLSSTEILDGMADIKEPLDETQEAEDEELDDDFDYDGIENLDFAHTRRVIDADPGKIAVPPQLTNLSCRGIGDPTSVWGVLCIKDKLYRVNSTPLTSANLVNPNVRSVLVDWMMELCEGERQHRETFHLAVEYIDKYLSHDRDLPVETLQCFGTTALFIASKYEEIYPPKLEQFVEYTDGACTNEQIQRAEICMLDSLQWSLSPVTSIHWLTIFLQLLGSKEEPSVKFGGHYSDKPIVVPQYLRDDYIKMAKVLDIALLDVDCRRFSCKDLAAGVLFAMYEPHSVVEKATGFTYDAILPAMEWLLPCVKARESNAVTADALPVFQDVRPEEWHDIQTHYGPEGLQKYYADVKEARKTQLRQIAEMKQKTKRSNPLRPLFNIQD